MTKPKLMRITTVAVSMNIILRGQLRYMSQYYEVVGVTSPDSKHFHECGAREGIRMVAIPMQRTIHVFKDLVALVRLFLLMRSLKPSIVHTHTPKAGLLGMLAAKFAGVPVRIHTVGGMPLTEAKGLKRKVLLFAEKLTYASAHRVLPNSYGLQSIIEELGLCTGQKLKVLANGSSNGVNTSYFSPNDFNITEPFISDYRRKLGIRDDAFVFLFVGRIAKDKGILELVDSFKKVVEKHPKTTLLLIGPFEQTHSILPDETKHEIQNNAAIIAPGRFDDVRPFYAISDVYVFPSYREGFPNSLMEAGAMGLPVIATDINGCNEIVEHRVNGLLIKPKCPESLLDAMLECIEHTPLRLEMKSFSRSIIEKKFENAILWDALYKEYNSFLTGNNL